MTDNATRCPAVLSYGFRPFFLLAALWALAAMVIWVMMLAGASVLPTTLDPFSWHAHEFVFGYTSAVITGFLLTAVPSWTRRPPVTGLPLAGLALLWLLGRGAVAFSAGLPAGVVMGADLALMLILGVIIAREIALTRNWRNLPVVLIVLIFVAANALFHVEALTGRHAASGTGLRFGLAAIVMLIAFIGGRIIPPFTRNWLRKRGDTVFPRPFGRADHAVLGLSAVALVAFVVASDGAVTRALLLVAGLANLWRMTRWRLRVTLVEPLLWVLQLAYFLIAIGFICVALAGTGHVGMAAALHVWMAGGIGVATLGMMTRVSLGHSGRPLHAGPGTVVIYAAMVLSVITRLIAGVLTEADWLLHAAGALWIIAFAGFVLLYWVPLVTPRPAKDKTPAGQPAT